MSNADLPQQGLNLYGAETDRYEFYSASDGANSF